MKEIPRTGKTGPPCRPEILNPSAWAADGPLVSNGAYVVDEWIHNERITLKKNPYYFEADNVRTETVIMMLTSDAAAAYSAYLSGAISVLNGRVPADVLPSLTDSPEMRVCSKKASSSLMFNIRSPLFAGMTAEEAATFRKAVRYAIDSQFLCDVVSNGTTVVCGTYVPKSMADGSGKPFSETEGFSYPEEYGYYPPQLGIHLSLSSREWAVFLGEQMNGNYEMSFTNRNADYDDPYNFLFLWTTDSPNNRAGLGR